MDVGVGVSGVQDVSLDSARPEMDHVSVTLPPISKVDRPKHIHLSVYGYTYPVQICKSIYVSAHHSDTLEFLW